MAKIKPLARKRLFRRWLRFLGVKQPRASDLLANIDEMHTVPTELPTLYFVCPCCGARTPMETPRSRSDGYTIAQTIIDEINHNS